MDQKVKNKVRYIESDRRESVNYNWKYIGTVDYFLNRTTIAHTLRTTINECGLMKLKASVKQRTLSVGQNCSQENVKIFSPTTI